MYFGVRGGTSLAIMGSFYMPRRYGCWEEVLWWRGHKDIPRVHHIPCSNHSHNLQPWLLGILCHPNPRYNFLQRFGNWILILQLSEVKFKKYDDHCRNMFVVLPSIWRIWDNWKDKRFISYWRMMIQFLNKLTCLVRLRGPWFKLGQQNWWMLHW
jgi:hypothetical protein